MSGITRCELIPQPQESVEFQIDGRLITTWNFSPSLKRPCFFPLNGPISGASLTRMGHPGAPDHDHHDSVWFAHDKVLGISFWNNASPAVIRQQQWLVYEDGDDAARMAVRLAWLDGHDPQPLLEQELIVVLRPLPDGEYTLSLSSTFTPAAERLELQQTNFGVLAVRVARSLSAVFGGGRLTSSTGETGEAALFGRPAEWIDYSGPMPDRSSGSQPPVTTEGITFFDHPQNPGYPVAWHVRDDGWMGAALCLSGPVTIECERPLHLSYLLHVHAGSVDPAIANRVREEWAAQPTLKVIKSMQPHRHFELVAR